MKTRKTPEQQLLERKLKEEYFALSNGSYTPAVEARMEEIAKEVNIKDFLRVRRHHLPVRGSYDEMRTNPNRPKEYKTV